MKPFLFILLVTVFFGCNEDKVVTPTTNTAAEIQRIADAQVTLGSTPGIIIGTLKDGKTTIYTAGVQNLSTGKPFDANTIAEIGSITKPMTSLMLAELVNQNRLSLSDPANKYLPASLQLPSKDGKEVTVLHLLNHTSGLPDNPDDTSNNPEREPQPFNYSENKLADYLKRTPLKTTPGTTFLYSNIGMGLAGVIVRQLTGERITKRYQDRIFLPLGMRSSFSHNTETPAANVAQGYMGRKPYAFFTMSDVFESAGCVKSNVNDMLAFLKFATSPPQHALGAAFNLTKQPTFTIDAGKQMIGQATYQNLRIGLAWGIINNDRNETIFNHTGGTYGFSTFLAFNEQRKTGVVILTNAAFTPELSKPGFQILSLLDK